MAVHLSNLNLNGNELQNFVVQPLATAPSGRTGLKFFNTTSGRESVYNGSKWLESAYMTDLEAITSTNTAIDNRLKAIEAYFSSEADSDSVINKWNEIVAFLNATEGTTLAGLLAAYVPTTRKVSAGTGLTGGGALSADITLSLATSGVTAGTYTKVTVDTYGRVTSGSTPTTLAGYSIGNAYTKTEVDNLISGVAESATKVSIKDLLTSGTKIATLTIDSTDYTINAPAIPDSLKCPYSLTIKDSAGTSQVSYDGSATKTLTLSKAMVGLSNVTNLAASGYLTDLSSNTANAVAITVGGTTKEITAATMKTSLGLKALAFKDSVSASDVGAAKKYAGSITKSSSTSYTITHNLGTRDVIVQVYDPSSYEQVLVDVKMTDTNKVTLTFASAPSANYRVVVIG